MTKKFLEALHGKTFPIPPVWLMRQAGRYLPEYRATRKMAGDFKTLVYRPDLACEVTLQPIRRYGFDAAILFSDILVVPDALGQSVVFEEARGPVLNPISDLNILSPERFHERLAPVYETVAAIRNGLVKEGFEETALIGFAGSPWTVACYMVDGMGSKEFAKTRTLALSDPQKFSALIDLLVLMTGEYLVRQIAAGAEAIQLFDSWAGVLSPSEFEKWAIAPTKKIVASVRAVYPNIPIIGFPKGAGLLLKKYALETGVTATGLDTQIPCEYAAKEIQPLCPVQGNLDPFVLLAGGKELEIQTKDILTTLAKGPFIFNLGHGIHKDTPPEHVATLMQTIRAGV
jgi:uroporphyrinogen decarboxylase